MEIYPNLELISYLAAEVLMKDDSIKKKLESEKKNLGSSPEFDIISFPQIWKNSNTGFDNEAAEEDSMLVKEYTCVVHELLTGTWLVFFGGKPCYSVTDPGSQFFEDVAAMHMAPLSEAKKRYRIQSNKGE